MISNSAQSSAHLPLVAWAMRYCCSSPSLSKVYECWWGEAEAMQATEYDAELNDGEW